MLKSYSTTCIKIRQCRHPTKKGHLSRTSPKPYSTASGRAQTCFKLALIDTLSTGGWCTSLRVSGNPRNTLALLEHQARSRDKHQSSVWSRERGPCHHLGQSRCGGCGKLDMALASIGRQESSEKPVQWRLDRATNNERTRTSIGRTNRSFLFKIR